LRALSAHTSLFEVRLHFATLAKTLPLLLLGACASTQVSFVDQPELAEMARSYAPQLQAVGITLIISRGSGAAVLLETGYGAVYVRYPATLETRAFDLTIGPDGVHARAERFDRVKDAKLLAALVPDAVRVTAINNRLGWLRANPWH